MQVCKIESCILMALFKTTDSRSGVIVGMLVSNVARKVQVTDALHQANEGLCCNLSSEHVHVCAAYSKRIQASC